MNAIARQCEGAHGAGSWNYADQLGGPVPKEVTHRLSGFRGRAFLFQYIQRLAELTVVLVAKI